MEREFVVKVMLKGVDQAEPHFIPLVIRATTAAQALAHFATRSDAELVGVLDAPNDSSASGAVGAGDRVFRVMAAERF